MGDMQKTSVLRALSTVLLVVLLPASRCVAQYLDYLDSQDEQSTIALLCPDLPPAPGNDLWSDEGSSAAVLRLKALETHWRRETEPEKRHLLRRAVWAEAAQLHARGFEDFDALFRDLMVDGTAEGKRIDASSVESTTVALQLIRDFPSLRMSHDEFSPNHPVFRIRRINADTLELWTTSTGWLMNRSGKILATARVPRKDGLGRDWFGAFLPDGSWVTTDIWETDKELHVFTRLGTWYRDVSTLEIHTLGKEKGREGHIDFAMADNKGKGWVLVADGYYWIGLDGPARRLTPHEAHALLDPRQFPPVAGLGVWGMPNDDWSRFASVFGPWKKSYTAFWQLRSFTLSASDDLVVDLWGAAEEADSLARRRFTQPIYALGEVGFWPRSNSMYVQDICSDPWVRTPAGNAWFYGDNGEVMGWLDKGVRVGDAADSKAMLFAQPDMGVLTVGADSKLLRRRWFAWRDSKPAEPAALFDDLNLGFFYHDEQLALACWKK